MTLRLTRDDVRALVAKGRRAPAVPVAAPEPSGAPIRLEVFVSGPLYNPMNGSHGHWSKHARWARQWRERTHLALFAAWPGPKVPERDGAWLTDGTPKRITFLAHTGASWDDDNLRAGLKPCRDALRDAGLIQSDAPDSGHMFTYSQRIDRKQRGVQITITPRALEPDHLQPTKETQ